MARALLFAFGVSSAASMSGCITEGSARPRPPIRNIPEPAGLVPDTLLLNATPFPVDADGNGYADTFTVSIFLFPPENQHPLPIYSEGVFKFTLDSEEDERIAAWTLTGEDVERAKVRPLTGPGYIFQLDINTVANDRVRARNGSLRCSFTPTDGERIDVRGPTIVRIGRTGLGSG